MNPETIILPKQQVSSLLDIEECIDAIESVFKLYCEGKVQSPCILGIHATDGGFHIKAAAIVYEKALEKYVGLKLNFSN